MTLAVIIVNFRTADLALGCLQSIAADAWLPGRGKVIVVDNASGDGSLEKLKHEVARGGWLEWVELVHAERNGGFAFGNNIGIRHTSTWKDKPPYLLLLNPDTIVRNGAIETMVRFLDERPRVGIVGSRLEGLDGVPQESAFRFPSIWSELDAAMRLGFLTRMLRPWVVAPPVRNEAHPTDWVAGASMMIRRELLEHVGPLDEDYFMYFEEVDFCRNTRKAGWECWYAPESRVVHFVGQSSGINSRNTAIKRLPSYWFESRRRYLQKNHCRLYAATTDLLWLAGNLTWKVRRAVQRKPQSDPAHFWRDMLRHSSLCNGIAK